MVGFRYVIVNTVRKGDNSDNVDDDDDGNNNNNVDHLFATPSEYMQWFTVVFKSQF